MDETSGTKPAEIPTQAQDGSRPAGAEDVGDSPGFLARGRMRRRSRYLRRVRELAYRDLGGLIYNLHRFGQRNDALVTAKLATLGQIDGELRGLERTLAERRSVTVLREAGITACARCAAIHSSEDRFCPNCGLELGRHADLPIAGPAATPSATAAASAAAAGAPASPAAAGAPASPAAASAPASSAAAGAPASPASAPPGAAPSPAAAQAAAPSPPAVRGRAPSPPASGDAGPEEPTEILRPPRSR